LSGSDFVFVSAVLERRERETGGIHRVTCERKRELNVGAAAAGAAVFG
jgi:hypothetical protein